MITKADVINMAFGYLGLQPVQGLEDPSEHAKVANLYWENNLYAFLEEYAWSFTIRYKVLARHYTKETGIWRNVFEVPADFGSAIAVYEGRLVRPCCHELDPQVTIEQTVFQRACLVRYEIFTDDRGNGVKRVLGADADYVELKYHTRGVTMDMMGAKAIEALAHRIAYSVGRALKYGSQEANQMFQVYQYALTAAKESDSQNSSAGYLNNDVYWRQRRV